MLANTIAENNTRFETIQLNNRNIKKFLALYIAKKKKNQNC